MAKKVEKRVPDIRFKGFTDDWEQRKLGNICYLSKGKGYSKKDLSDNGTPIFLYGRLYTQYEEKTETISTFANKNNDSIISTGEEVVLPDSGETAVDIARASWVTKPGIILAGGLLILKPRTSIASGFLAYVLSYGRNHKLLASKAQGKTIVHIHLSNLNRLRIIYPINKSEQIKIEAVLNLLNNLITLQQKKLEQLKLLKKAMLQQLFPDKDGKLQSRFNVFTDDWEQRKFFDTVEKIIYFSGRTPKKLGMEWSAKGYPALSAVNVRDGYIDFSVDVHYANKELYDRWMSGNDLYKGQVVFTTEAPMGNVAQIPDNQKYILSQRTIAFKIDNTQLTDDFLAVLLRSPIIQHSLKLLASGGTAQGVSQKSLSQLKVFIPTKIKEQQLIGKYFHSLDTLITLHQRKLDHLKLLKKFLLQRIFI